MIPFLSIPNTPGMVIRSISVNYSQLDLPQDSVYLFWDKDAKELKIWDGVSVKNIVGEGVIENPEDELDSFFMFVSKLPFTDDALP
ncbi:hypothetical protein HNP86_001886 [Methanococcus maripaludis]|uniref:Uncharacterized protein n=1 Tax=Methanococcus maripaludis TaxID=39152 RepID=A0A7J9NWM9_METMI|nr:hypothetical protein [Methanococcus maripaludis]MBA2851727.1 hypothetical protein [Methanococcus maripaludis]